MQSRLIRLIGVVFLNGTMLLVWDKSDSVNECTQEKSELRKLHIQGVWLNAHKFIRQLAQTANALRASPNLSDRGVGLILDTSSKYPKN